MEAKMKQRLIGIGVLVIAAIIIVPFLLHHPKKQPQQVSMHIQPPPVTPATNNAQVEQFQAPKMTAVTAPAPEKPTKTTPAATQYPVAQHAQTQAPVQPAQKPVTQKPVVGQTNPAKAAVSTTEKQPPVVNRHNTHSHHAKAKPKAATQKAWTVQLASFAEESHAKNLVKRLQSRGFSAYEHAVKTKKGPLTRVYVGPELNKADAKHMLVKLQKLFKLKGLVVEYKV